MKKIFLLIVVLALSVGTTNVYGQNEKKALRNAETHVGYDEFKAAIPYLKEAIGYNPRNAMSQFLLGKCLFINYEKKEALKHFEAAYKLNKDVDAELSYYHAQSLHYMLKFDEAVTQYERALTKIPKKDPRYREVQMEIGHCKYAKDAVKHPVNAQIVNIGPPINTQHSEHSPIIDADETVLYYTTVRPDNIGCKNEPTCPYEDIYVSEKSGKGWGAPHAVKELNTKDYDASIALSTDGQTMFLYKNPPGNGDVFITHLEGEKWSSPKSVGEPVNSKSYENTVSISGDEKIMFFTSDREGGYGDTDIYMCRKDEEGEWGDAINLGPKINTPYRDESPFFHPDGITMYFSSNGRSDCLGGFDIYETQLTETGEWTKPKNMGYPINTPDNDIYFVLSADKKTGYYASAKEGGYGEKDIYKIIIPEEKPVVVKEEDTLVPVEVKPVNALTILKGIVTDAKSKAPLEAAITVIDNDKNMVVSTLKSNSATGRYLVSLPSGRNYGITVEATDYLFKSVNVNIPKSQGYQEIVKDIALDKIEIGVGIVLNNIFYDVDKATLRPESVAELEHLNKLMVDNPKIKIEIGGHTDSDGSDAHNEVLSQNRAQSVVDFLVDKGVNIDRMVAKGYGEKVNVAPNDTKENKQLNRRTELKILEN